MKNIVENIIANMLVVAISACLGFILHALGVTIEDAVVWGLVIFVVLYVVGWKGYPIIKKWLTIQLAKSALETNSKKASALELRDQVKGLVARHNHGVKANESYLLKVYPNQVKCESEIIKAFQKAKKVKILTIRGEKYFLGSKSLLHDLTILKQAEDISIQVLVLVPGSLHITEKLARELRHSSADDMRDKMKISFDNLMRITKQHAKFQLRFYNETPIFKMLVFDDIMFVSAYIKEKNDHNTQMLRIAREDVVLFGGFEKEFDDLWERSDTPERIMDGRV